MTNTMKGTIPCIKGRFLRRFVRLMYHNMVIIMKKTISVLLSISIFTLILSTGFTAFSANELQKDSDGCYLIDTAEDLYAFADLVNGGEASANAKLTSDITVNENVLDENGELNIGNFREWYPIADRNNY